MYACNTDFRVGGADHSGDWIHGDTWDPSEKIHVEGEVDWPQATVSIAAEAATRVITSNGLPDGDPTGVFPVAPGDPAYQIDRNPNAISEQLTSLSIPLNPTLASSPSCLPRGSIGLSVDGVAIFNALDDAGLDAVANEVQDICDGHPQGTGTYHYHGISACDTNIRSDQLIGYAADGFGIFGPIESDGHELTTSDLDECHGRTSAVPWDGETVDMYHYVATQEYPYTLGCFRGTPVSTR